jgi:hypothetical protein
LKVNFFIVGAPKCGTTALSDYLSEHPGICMAVPKEPTYFADDLQGLRYVTSLEEYEALFACKGKNKVLAGDASPAYMFSQTAIANIHEYNPDAKLIVMLRNPVETVYSSHSQLLYSLFEDEEDFGRAWALQTARKNGENIPAKCREAALLQYREVAAYPEQLERLFEVFPKDRVKIILFDEFVKDTSLVYNEVIEFLGLDEFSSVDFSIRNPRKKSRYAILNSIIHSPPDFLVKLLRSAGKGMLHRWIIKTHGWLKNINTEVVAKEEIPADTRRMLYEVFEEDIRRLEVILGRDLSSWQ